METGQPPWHKRAPVLCPCVAHLGARLQHGVHVSGERCKSGKNSTSNALCGLAGQDCCRLFWTFSDLAYFLSSACSFPQRVPHFNIHVCPDFSAFFPGLFSFWLPELSLLFPHPDEQQTLIIPHQQSITRCGTAKHGRADERWVPTKQGKTPAS